MHRLCIELNHSTLFIYFGFKGIEKVYETIHIPHKKKIKGIKQ